MRDYFVSFVYFTLWHHNVRLVLELTFLPLNIMSFTIFYVVCAKTLSYFILFDCYTVLQSTDVPV